MGKKLCPHPTGQTQTEGEKELHKLYSPNRENLKERKHFGELDTHVEYIIKIYLTEIRYEGAGRVQLGVLLRQQMNIHFPP